MAYTTINKSSLHMNTKLYTGNGSTQNITGVGFQPDLVWIKHRNGTSNHNLFDAIRGVTKYIESSSTAPDQTGADRLTAFGTDGFTTGGNGGTNGNNDTYASWHWKANGAGSANTDGSINTTATSVNTTAGFSIVKYTGNATSGATVGHGLGAVPKMIFVKCTSTNGTNWIVYTAATGNTHWIYLNSTAAAGANSAAWNDTSPTASVFSLGNDGDVNGSGRTYIAYCFADKTGYSKFGSYVGNGANFDNAFVYTGFKPALVIIKKSNTTGNWVIEDNKRAGYNQANYHLYPNLSNAEGTNYYTDFLSNGFKIRDNPSDIGESGHTYIYMAFAEAPLVGTNNIPCTAR